MEAGRIMTGRVAAVQMTSGPGVPDNLRRAEESINQAAGEGAGLVVLPENFALMGAEETHKVREREQPGDGPIQDFLARSAARHGVWLVGGTVPLAAAAPDRVRAACLVYDADGRLAARYDKLHLFDVSLEAERETYCESSTIEAGAPAPVVVDTPFGRLGLAVCYDLRFPELFRALVDQQAELIAVPAAFTAPTGQAHWEVLLRARAIENLCYVAAAAQVGLHANGRRTHGDSMIVDPWGQILARRTAGEGVVTADVSLERLRHTRTHFPCLAHRRLR